MTLSLMNLFQAIGLGTFESTILIGILILLVMAIFIFLMRGGMALGLFIGGILMFGLAGAYGGVFFTFYILGILAVGGAFALFLLGLNR